MVASPRSSMLFAAGVSPSYHPFNRRQPAHSLRTLPLPAAVPPLRISPSRSLVSPCSLPASTHLTLHVSSGVPRAGHTRPICHEALLLTPPSMASSTIYLLDPVPSFVLDVRERLDQLDPPTEKTRDFETQFESLTEEKAAPLAASSDSPAPVSLQPPI